MQGITVGKSIFSKKINDMKFRFVVVGDMCQGFKGWGYLKFLHFVENIEFSLTGQTFKACNFFSVFKKLQDIDVKKITLN